jgi:hypothetical protein
LLPPRLGGPLALIEGAPDSDVVFIGHEGFEGAAKVKDVVRGSIVGRTIRVTAWKVSAADIPTDRDEQVEWLYANWARIDAWLVNGTEPAEVLTSAPATP